MASSAAGQGFSLLLALNVEAPRGLDNRKPLACGLANGGCSLNRALDMEAPRGLDNTRQAEPSEELRPRGAGPFYSSEAGRVSHLTTQSFDNTRQPSEESRPRGAGPFYCSEAGIISERRRQLHEDALHEGAHRLYVEEDGKCIPRIATWHEEAHRLYVEEDGKEFLTKEIKTKQYNIGELPFAVTRYRCTLCNNKEAPASHHASKKHKRRLERFRAERNERAMRERARQTHMDDGPPGIFSNCDHGHCQPAGWAASGASVTDTRRVQYYYRLLRGVDNRSL